jgi:hypothetical protein
VWWKESIFRGQAAKKEVRLTGQRSPVSLKESGTHVIKNSCGEISFLLVLLFGERKSPTFDSLNDIWSRETRYSLQGYCQV